MHRSWSNQGKSVPRRAHLGSAATPLRGRSRDLLRWQSRRPAGWRDVVVGPLFCVRWLHFPRAVISLAVRWYLFIEAARPCRHPPSDQWFRVRPTSRSPVGGRTCTRPSTSTARSSTSSYLSDATWQRPGVSSPRHCNLGRSRPRSPLAAPGLPAGPDELVPDALHTVERYANNPIEADHGRLKARLQPMRGQKRPQHGSSPLAMRSAEPTPGPTTSPSASPPITAPHDLRRTRAGDLTPAHRDNGLGLPKGSHNAIAPVKLAFPADHVAGLIDPDASGGLAPRPVS